MIENVSFEIGKGGIRLDAAVLSYCPSSTRAFVREAVAQGRVVVNGRASGKGAKLSAGDKVSVMSLKETSDNSVRPDPFFHPVEIFADSSILAFDKPAGMPVQPLSCSETGTLMNAVAYFHPECAPLGDRPLMAGAVHRIDADTSGLVLVARTAAAFDSLRAQFASQSVEKVYYALVEGSVAVGGTLEDELVHDPSMPCCKMVRPSRLTRSQLEKTRVYRAVTSYEVDGHTTCGNEERTLLKVTIFTGVTHQIRAQLALAGMHIVNDRLYGAFAVEGQTGHCLHSFSASFLHPDTSDRVTIQTPPRWLDWM